MENQHNSTGRREYTDAERAHALAVLASVGSSLRASTLTGIPSRTIRAWADGTNGNADHPDVQALRQEAREALAVQFEKLASMALGIAVEKLPSASAYQASLIAAISTDKATFLRGGATSVIECRSDSARDDRVERLREVYGRLHPAPEQPSVN